MIAFMVQLALLLLVAYFAGAFVGCVVRRTFFSHTLEEAALAVPVAATAAASNVAQTTVAQASVATPVGPANSGQTRFERALSGTGSAGAPAPAPVPAAAPAPTPAPVPSPPIAAAPAPAKPAAPVASASPVPAAPLAPVPAAAAPPSAVAAAMSAVAAAAKQQQSLPAAMGTSGPASVTAPIAPVAAPVSPPAPTPAPAPAPVAAAEPAVAQDLTRIRAIDEAIQKALNGLGVRTFADIANWKPADVSRIADALKMPGRIEQENWIEQAQILAKGGETYYSRRKLKGELPTGRPTPDEGERITVRVPAGTRVEEAPAPAPAVDLKAAAAAAAAAVQAAQAQMAAPPAPAPVAAPAAKPPVEAPVVAVPAAQVQAQPAAPAAAAPAPSPAPSPAPAPTVTAPAVGIARDVLQRIAGINAEVERLLNVQGVTRFSQIAGWSASDVARFDRLLGFEGRISRENWIEQAQILSKGGETAYSREMARRVAEPPRPARLADAIQSRASAPAAPPASSDLSGLRSVRSEAYRGPDAASSVAPGRGPDDLKRIRGVGVLIEKKLNGLGVSRYDQVANWTQADIERFSEKLDFKGRIERENWVEQARILSAGGQTEFSQRVDRGEVETSKPKV